LWTSTRDDRRVPVVVSSVPLVGAAGSGRGSGDGRDEAVSLWSFLRGGSRGAVVSGGALLGYEASPFGGGLFRGFGFCSFGGGGGSPVVV